VVDTKVRLSELIHVFLKNEVIFAEPPAEGFAVDF
jgi:hypothetical protein